MITLIPQSHYQNMPWKNGLGVTAQIDIAPTSEGQYLWRLSSATVSGAGPFSIFPGCDRWLAVFKGEGLILNGEMLPPLKTLNFSGETPIECTLVEGPVVDLGLIYRRDKVTASMVHHHLAPHSERTLHIPGETSFFFVTSGTLVTEELTARTGDTLRLENLISLQVKNPSDEDLHFLHVSISEKTLLDPG